MVIPHDGWSMHGLLWAIFALVYLGMALGRLPGVALDRTGVALLGAIAMIAVRGIGLSDAARAVDFQTILLLFSLMLFSAQLADAVLSGCGSCVDARDGAAQTAFGGNDFRQCRSLRPTGK